MNITTKVYVISIIGLLILLLITGVGWQISRNQISELQNQITTKQLQAENQKVRETATLAELNRKNAEEIAMMRVTALEQEHQLRSQISEIKSQYDINMLANKRLRDQISVLNGQLSTYSRETVENYATTAANNLAECSVATADLERIALEYDREIVRLRDSWPKQPTAVIKVIDPKTNETKSFYGTIKIKTDISNIEEVITDSDSN
jgi:hypothetical protein